MEVQLFLHSLAMGIKKATRRFGVDLMKHYLRHLESKIRAHVIREYQINTILDVGANIGRYSLDLLKNDYKGLIYSFEPIPSVIKSLALTAKKYSCWHLYNLGVGSTEAEMMINVTENFVGSSILKADEASITAEPTTRITHQEKIKLTTIDSSMNAHSEMKGEFPLKLDVQGYELETLVGSLKSPERIKLIQAEFANLCQNSPRYDGVAAFLKGYRFGIFTIIPGFRDEKTGRLLQAEGLFIRA